MKSVQIYEILENTPLTYDIMKMVLKGDTSWIKNPGQFINITIDHCYLKRPISICDWDAETLTIIYKVVGKGTTAMKAMQPKQKIEALVGLGNGFDLAKLPEELVILAGGVGVPPMYGLAKRCIEANKKVHVILGFASAKDAFYLDEFKKLKIDPIVTSNDGSIGLKGFVTDGMKQEKLEECVYAACGPMPMLKAIYQTSKSHGYLSFEERMGCGFGACMGCSCKTITGYKRICVEGPVMESEDLLWKD